MITKKKRRNDRMPPSSQLIFDEIDSDLAALRWNSDRQGYAQRKNVCGKERHEIRAHRVVLARILGRSLTPKDICDHANRDKYDNRRSNLRLATASQNSANRLSGRIPESGYRGVVRCKKKWRAQIKPHGLRIIGVFCDPKDAAKAYDRAAIAIYGEFAVLNFESSRLEDSK